MQTKQCTTCNQEKQTTEFSKHKTGKYGVSARCLGCDKLYRYNNKHRITEYHKHHNQKNKECKAEYMIKWRQDNKDCIAEYKKQYRQDNKDQIKEYNEINKIRITEYHNQYRKTPKGQAILKANRQNRRALEKNTTGSHTGAEILQLFDLQSGVCAYCKTKLHKSGKNKSHSDHIVPLSKGGTNDIANIQLLCAKCNLSKSNKLPENFAAECGLLF